jgi:transposase
VVELKHLIKLLLLTIPYPIGLLVQQVFQEFSAPQATLISNTYRNMNNLINPEPNKVVNRYLTVFQRKTLENTLQKELSEQYRQRILIMLLTDEGKTQSEICQILNCCPATARHWILMAKTGMAHQWQNSPIGRPKTINDQYLDRLQELVNHSPQDYGYAFRRWTGKWLSQHLARELGIEVNERHINRLLHKMGLSTSYHPERPDDSLENTHKCRIIIRDLSSTDLEK